MAEIAFTVARNQDDTSLSPFFGKARWILVVDPATGLKSYIRNRGRTSEWVRASALAYAVDGLACAYVANAALRRLTEAGVDMRLASDACEKYGQFLHCHIPNYLSVTTHDLLSGDSKHAIPIPAASMLALSLRGGRVALEGRGASPHDGPRGSAA